MRSSASCSARSPVLAASDFARDPRASAGSRDARCSAPRAAPEPPRPRARPHHGRTGRARERASRASEEETGATADGLRGSRRARGSRTRCRARRRRPGCLRSGHQSAASRHVGKSTARSTRNGEPGHAVAGSHVQRDVVAGGERARVPPVPVEELDHAADPSAGVDPLFERLGSSTGSTSQTRAVVHERVRGALEARRLVGDPAEAERELVAEARSHLEAARIGR